MSRASLRKLSRMAVLAFQNALRLHGDAVLLFRAGSYPSAFGLSVYSLEEVGKYSVLEDHVWQSMVAGRPEAALEEKVVKLVYDHRRKQAWFASGLDFWRVGRTAIRRLSDGSVEREKQLAFYVSLPRRRKRIDMGGRISTPGRITKSQAERQLTLMNDFLVLLTAGVLQGEYVVDIDEMEAVLTPGLLESLRADWPRMSAAGRSALSAITRPLASGTGGA